MKIAVCIVGVQIKEIQIDGLKLAADLQLSGLKKQGQGTGDTDFLRQESYRTAARLKSQLNEKQINETGKKFLMTIVDKGAFLPLREGVTSPMRAYYKAKSYSKNHQNAGASGEFRPPGPHKSSPGPTGGNEEF